MNPITEILFALITAVLWAIICQFMDARGSKNQSQDSNVHMSPNPHWIATAAAMLGCIAALAAPQTYKIAAALIVSAFTVAAYADFVHRIFWEEISITTLIAVLGAQAYSGHGQSSATGAAILGGGFCIIYFIAIISGRETGVGDLLPVTTLGAAYGTLPGLEAFGVGAVAIIIGALTIKKIGKEIPMGPGLALAGLLGVIFLRVMPNIST